MTSAPTIENPAYFDRLAEIEGRHWWSLGVWRLAAHWLGAELRGRSGLRAIDVGCGTGMTTLRLARLGPVGDVVGLDPSPDALAHARGRHAFPLVEGSLLDLPFEDRAFDVATCFDVIQHVPEGERGRAVAELFRVLRPGGVVLVRSNGRGWSGDASAYRLDDLAALVTSAGFSVRRRSYANCLPAIAQEIRGRLARGRSHPSGGGLRIRLPHPVLNCALRAVAFAEADLAGAWGVRLPFGHSTMVLAARPG